MKNNQKILSDALEKVKTIDPHCHLNLQKPTANTLADIIFYHHLWVELISSGMSQFEVTESGLPQELRDPGIPSLERVRRGIKYLPNIRNTTIGVFLKLMMQDLYDVGEINDSNFEKISDLIENRNKDEKWTEEVLQTRCGIEFSISVESEGIPSTKRLLKGREIFLTNAVSGKNSAFETIKMWEKLFGKEIASAQSYAEFLGDVVKSLSPDGYKFIGVWVLPNISSGYSKDSEIDAVLRKIRENRIPDSQETGTLCYFGLRTLLQHLRETPLRVIQMIVGAEVLPPHRSITHWDGSFAGSAARIANEFEDFHFNLSTASDLYSQDLGILAKHIPNISVAGYWWHTLYPFYIRKSLETRLDMVPLNKIIAFFSDAYHAEWCYPKLRMVKQILRGILFERIEKGWYSVDFALEVINKIFYENPKLIYRIGE